MGRLAFLFLIISLNTFAAKKPALNIAQARELSDAEGLYEVMAGDKAARLSIVYTGNNIYIAGLVLNSTTSSPVDLLFPWVVYNSEDKTYEALNFGTNVPDYDLPGEFQHLMRFRLAKNDGDYEVRGVFLSSLMNLPVSGRRTAAFRGVPEGTSSTSITGRYTGTTQKGEPLALMVGRVDNVFSASLVYTDTRLILGLPYSYYDKHTGAYFFSGGPNQRNLARMFQVRGRFTPDGFEGTFLNTYQGELVPLTLKRDRLADIPAF